MRALPLVIAGLLAATTAWSQPPPPAATLPAPPASSAPEFETTVPGLESGRLAPAPPPTRVFRVGEPALGLVQQRNRRTGTTCTLRIVVAPPVDRAMVQGGAAGSADRIVRNDVSPCTE